MSGNDFLYLLQLYFKPASLDGHRLALQGSFLKDVGIAWFFIDLLSVLY
jgi:hypothetical protein